MCRFCAALRLDRRSPSTDCSFSKTRCAIVWRSGARLSSGGFGDAAQANTHSNNSNSTQGAMRQRNNNNNNDDDDNNNNNNNHTENNSSSSSIQGAMRQTG
jgi:hypothetical protein